MDDKMVRAAGIIRDLTPGEMVDLIDKPPTQGLIDPENAHSLGARLLDQARSAVLAYVADHGRFPGEREVQVIDASWRFERWPLIEDYSAWIAFAELEVFDSGVALQYPMSSRYPHQVLGDILDRLLAALAALGRREAGQ